MELGRIRADDFPHDLSRYTQVPANLLDRLVLNEKRPTNLGDRFHNQHSNLGLPKSRRPMWTLSPGVPIGCKSPQKRGPYSMLIHTPPILAGGAAPQSFTGYCAVISLSLYPSGQVAKRTR